MAPGILGRKIGMTQVFDEQGRVVPVTALQAGPCVVVQRKTRDKDGYEAVQLGLVEFVAERHVNKPSAGRFKGAGVEPSRFLSELRLDDDPNAELKAGDRVLASEFKPKQKVDVVGTSKGKGFQGVIKRHGFAGGPDTHGSMTHRVPGSIGQSSYPSRVLRGTRMGGQTGNKRITTVGLEIVRVIEDDNVILVRGAVPGANGSYVVVRRSRK
ncbi:MAG: 50S ribosomal protein L3 [Acidobacteria bacterium]|nr:50S ribosomal protein L3 [Acidobacteriota bacterium]